MRLGGAFIPQGDVFYIETPKILHRYTNVSSRYENVVFDRKLAMRKRRAELFGIGHPLVDALIEHLKSPLFPGEVSISETTSENYPISIRCVFVVNFEDGMKKVFYKGFYLSKDGKLEQFQPKADIKSLSTLRNKLKQSDLKTTVPIPEWLKGRVVSIISEEEARLRAKFDKVLSINSKVVGLFVTSRS